MPTQVATFAECGIEEVSVALPSAGRDEVLARLDRLAARSTWCGHDVIAFPGHAGRSWPHAVNGSTGDTDGIGGLQVRRLTALDDAVRARCSRPPTCAWSARWRRWRVRTRAVWVDTDGEHVVLNSTPRRSVRRPRARRARDVHRRQPGEPLRVRVDRGPPGRSGDLAGADQHIDAMASKYLGLAAYRYHDPRRTPDHHPHPPRPRGARAPRGRSPRLSGSNPIWSPWSHIGDLGDRVLVIETRVTE